MLVQLVIGKSKWQDTSGFYGIIITKYNVWFFLFYLFINLTPTANDTYFLPLFWFCFRDNKGDKKYLFLRTQDGLDNQQFFSIEFIFDNTRKKRYGTLPSYGMRIFFWIPNIIQILNSKLIYFLKKKVFFVVGGGFFQELKTSNSSLSL
jgi:hypothetical protein